MSRYHHIEGKDFNICIFWGGTNVQFFTECILALQRFQGHSRAETLNATFQQEERI